MLRVKIVLKGLSRVERSQQSEKWLNSHRHIGDMRFEGSNRIQFMTVLFR